MRPLTLNEVKATFNKWGVRYVVVDGAATRDNGSHWSGGTGITGLMEHHTAGDAADNLELKVLVNGRTGLRGPLCNFGVGDDAVVDIIALGSANHAGKGDPKTLALIQKDAAPLDREIKPTMSSASSASVGLNSKLYGWEVYYGIRNDPTMNPQQHRALILSMVAIIDKLDEIDVKNKWTAGSVIGHRESTTAKIDPSGVKMYEERKLINKVRAAGPAAAKVWFETGSFPTAPKPEVPPVAVPPAPPKPNYRGSTVGQEVAVALDTSDSFFNPDKDSDNTFITGANWHKYVGYYTRDTLLAAGRIEQQITDLTEKVEALTKVVAALALAHLPADPNPDQEIQP